MLCRDLREEISTVKDDCLQLQGQCWTKVTVDSEHSQWVEKNSTAKTPWGFKRLQS